MTPSELAKFYLRYLCDGRLADNAPDGAKALQATVTGPTRRAFLWEVVKTIADKKPIPTPSDSNLYVWVHSYPGAIDMVADWHDDNKNKVKFWFGVRECWRAEFLAMTDIVHKHLTSEGAT